MNRRLAYVGVSRGRYDAHIYTDNKRKLAHVLDRDVSHRSALEKAPEPSSTRQSVERETTRSGSIGQSMAVGPS